MCEEPKDYNVLIWSTNFVSALNEKDAKEQMRKHLERRVVEDLEILLAECPKDSEMKCHYSEFDEVR